MSATTSEQTRTIEERLRDQARRVSGALEYPAERTLEWEAATAIASLREERDEWQQCCKTEARLRREFLERAEKAEERVRVLEGALEPFAKFDSKGWSGPMLKGFNHGGQEALIAVRHFEAARDALNEHPRMETTK